MITKMTHTVILMLTIDLESARQCEELSKKVYNENNSKNDLLNKKWPYKKNYH